MESKKRKGKFYSKNEKDVMEEYGLKATPQSGSGWLIKEDGYNGNVLAQLKSTDSMSYRITLDDIDKLEYHAMVEHKIPLFIVEFLQRDERYLVLKPQDLALLYKSLTLPENAPEVKSESQNGMYDLFVDIDEEDKNQNKKIIKSSKQSKDKLLNQMEKERNKNYECYRKSKKKL